MIYSNRGAYDIQTLCYVYIAGSFELQTTC